MSGARGSIFFTSTAMRLPLTTTWPAAIGMLFARILTSSSSVDSSSMMAPQAEPQHLMDRHGCGAEHHRYIEGDFFEDGQGRDPLLLQAKSPSQNLIKHCKVFAA